jgi:hypothetical protein
MEGGDTSNCNLKLKLEVMEGGVENHGRRTK